MVFRAILNRCFYDPVEKVLKGANRKQLFFLVAQGLRVNEPETFAPAEFTGDEYIWTDGDTLGFGLLPAGDYLYSFCVNDIFGGSYATPNADIVINEGNISFNYAA